MAEYKTMHPTVAPNFNATLLVVLPNYSTSTSLNAFYPIK
jgi:hypothetical protein